MAAAMAVAAAQVITLMAPLLAAALVLAATLATGVTVLVSLAEEQTALAVAGLEAMGAGATMYLALAGAVSVF
jgi:hypothetical protein